jgi:AcrR family transcriptional regulator
MRMKSPDLLIHPVRLRIVQAFFGDRRLAAEDLAEILADVPKATLYRHLATLADAGVLAVAAEQPARGTPRRIYVLAQGQARLTPAEMAQLGPEEQLHAFTVFVGTLLGDFARYAADGTSDPAADGVSYGQFALNVSDQELNELVGRLSAALAPALDNELTPGRRRRTLTTVLMPAGAAS